MAKIVHIPLIGHVNFPDGMEDGQITEAAARLHDDARNAAISKFMENDPTIKSRAILKSSRLSQPSRLCLRSTRDWLRLFTKGWGCLLLES